MALLPETETLSKNTQNPPLIGLPRPSPSDGQATPTSLSSSLSHLVAGASGGIVTAILTSPLDVLRTRLQSDFYRSQLKTSPVSTAYWPLLSVFRSSSAHFRETFHILATIHRVEGWRSLFRGLGPSLTGVVPATAVKFYTYGNCKRLLPNVLECEADTTLVHALSAATAGVVTGTVTNPIWLVKTRLQLDKSRVGRDGSTDMRKYRNSIDCLRQVVQQEGIRGLYRGLAASYLGVAETVLHLVTYEKMKDGFLKPRDDRSEAKPSRLFEGAISSSAAGLSKLLAVLVAYPHEVIRTRLRQAPMTNGRQKYTGLIQCLRLIYKEEGIAAVYGGLTAHLLRTVPAAAITLGTYELVLKIMNN
ncbi:hypothetical protein CNMCM5793_003673 [Aspergillus hiratsukae]|uniref:Mitochondrial thiamine pyrophosphate carrier 1 n=1 Tax=Aspergillus hiratsukae TaxID=1194566 RepID=A0A8H6PF95_9EURO|nr:hypothetical protein CNMCM5793_003673 [Aspergillus hiratsukae]KAF7169794.1 hypothetical protein CNMCM6106_004713 [Aspergillus hiratsukae]